uniref:CSON001936 protein n=1 Tax=Culicoides sonorensis TaxID=179676 RepID=A0A336MKE4_CULSO
MRGHTGYFLASFIGVSLLLVLLQIAFQIVLAVIGSDFLVRCEFLEKLFRHLGFIKLSGVPWQQWILWLYPEVLAFIASVCFYCALHNLVIGHLPPLEEGEERPPLSERPDYDAGPSPEQLKICLNIGKITSIVFLLFAAVFHPSAINGIYFLVFLGAATWWSCAKELERGLLFRPVLLSLPYLLFLLYLPFVPVATIKTMRGMEILFFSQEFKVKVKINAISGHTGYFLASFIGVSLLLVLLQIAFQIVLAVIGSDFLVHCEFLEKLFRHLGFIKLSGVPWQQWILWLYPEVLAFIASVCFYCALHNLVIGHLPPLEEGEERPPLSERPDYDAGPSPEQLKICLNIGKITSIVFLLFAAVFHPSAINGIYFLVFLGAATWWSCAKELERGFGIVLRCTMAVFIIHIFTFIVYQTPWPQEFLDKNSTVARVLGFTPLIYSECNDTALSANLTSMSLELSDTTFSDLDTNFTSTTPAPVIVDPVNDIRVIQFAKYNADYYLNPVFLILCYYTIALTSSLLLTPKEKHQHEVEEPPNERTPLMRGGTRKIRDIKTISQEVPGTSSSGDVIQMEEMGTSGTETVPDEDKTTFGEQFLSGLNNVLSFIYQNSYIFTNVVMMSWSIVYHSWFGFVYLIWSNLIWILPKQRMNMLRSSPFLVLYAEFLLLINYIYGMDLYEDELPSWVKTQGISLEQIGIIRFREYPCRSLILKSMFTGMFWITLRQMIQEKKAERKSSTLADMVAPLTVTVSPATSALSRRPEPKSSEFVTKLGNIINSFLVKGWIWIVAITLFIFGISGGDNMTMFRIIYMALFLFFVITFQLSLETWRKILYGFWLAVIIYSMAILILVYTYQFDRFDEHWENITHISKELQHDIGLEKYETKQLFLHLLTPTLIVIITVIQLHYCHKKFLVISEIPTHASPETEREEGQESDSNSIYGGIEEDEEEKILSRQASKRIRLIEKIKNRTLTRRDLQKALNLLWKRILYLSEYVWVFLEIHFLKIIMVFAFYLAVNHVRFLHILFATVAALGVGCRSQNQILTSKIASLFCSILLILTMIYQIKYIKEEDYAYNCHPNATMPNETLPETRTVLNNTAIWFGFIKSNKKTPLLTLITPYLAYIVLVTVHSVVTLRQTIRRIRLGQPVQTAKLLFPKIVRKDADKDIPHLLMYLCNYGFYKFGIEISLVMLTFVIGRRMDIYALIYAFWLCGLFVLDRTKLSNIWGSLRWFLVGSIITQYLTFVGLPPRLCIDYPWTSRLFDGFQIWAMLPDNTLEFRARSKILLSDFILLLVVCRQLIVFRIEDKYKDNANEYSGGSNQSVVKDIDELGQVPFTNPTPDFVEKIRNWLDISKRILFLVFFWITLAIVFLAGTNRVNLFSIGYLVGSFTFLWQGTDFYLRPIRLILKWWNMLIGYTVFVISLKAMLQIAGCFYIKDLMKGYCWLVQLLGISCICYPKAIDETDLEKCSMEMEDVKLLWDGVCFTFLIIQKRLFSSHYFCHIINETKASTILASRGAELIEELRAKEMKLEQEREMEVLEKLKAKMDRIKATQQKLLESAKEPAHHAKEPSVAPLARRMSLSSCTGYHTPIEDDVATSVLIEGDEDDDDEDENGSDLLMLDPRMSQRGSLLQPQVHSPQSALMTASLEAYMDPQRFSFSSPPESDIINRISSPDETFPVFSPPASATEADAPPLDVSERLPLPPGPIYTLMPPPEDGFVAAQQRRHQRQASLNIISLTTPQPDIGPLSPGRRRSSSTVFPTLEPESQAPPIPRPRTRHRRQSSVATSYAQEDLPRDRRQSSQVTSWYADNLDEDDETTISRGKTRWGKVGERSFRESLRSNFLKITTFISRMNHFKGDKVNRGSKKIGAQIEEPRAHGNEKYINDYIFFTSDFFQHHSQPIRSGDYYMFDKLEDEYKLEMPDDKDELDEEEKQTKEGKRLSRKMTLGQLMDKMKDESVRKAKEEELKLARRQSFPGLRKYREEGVEPAQTQQEQDRSAKSEPIPPQKFDADDEPGQDTEAGLTQSDDPQPSTSKSGTATAEETEMSKLLEEDKQRQSRIHFSGLNLILSFINSLLVSITIRLHRVSRNYRFVMRVLAKEKRNLKNKPGFGAGMRTGASMVWTPQGVSRASSRNLAVVATDSVVVSSNNNLNQNGIQNPLDSHNDDTNPPSGVTTPEHDHDPKFDVKERLQGVGAAMLKLASRDPHHAPIDREVSLVPEIRVLAPSLEQGLDDDFDSFKDDGSIGSKHESPVKKDDDDSDEEDFASKEHNIFVELIIAAWYAILSHTDFICYFFVFLNQINSASILSLPLPLLVLLWGTLTFPRPSKTFWITLIAYTQIVVLLKCISQFKSLWWNEQAITDNEPFAAARIIGIERTKGYATYDLILLLVVFCHRFILKSLGLWKSDFTDDSIAEGVYTAEVAVKDEKDKKDDEEERLYIVKQDDIEVKLKKVDSEAQLGSRGSADVVIVTKTVEEPSSYCPGILKLTFQKYLSSTRAFYLQLIDRRSRKTADVYTLLFLCDFINFFVILGGFSAFGTAGGDQSVMSYFEENKVPITFLFMLLIQFFLIVIDRALYLRKYMVGKIVFQFFLIIGLHIWMFFLLPATTERRFNASNPPIIYYLIKCCHLLFSAYQIRCGYPTRILGNFITKGYSLLNNLGFKLFMNIPFLFELRTLMDWVWTDTSFSVFDWLKMEDIFANVYQLKCSRVFEDRMPVPRGQKRKPMIKYLMGGFMVGALIILIWFPLALFAFSSAVGEPNIPYDVSISLRIGPYEPVYTMSAQNSKIYELKDQNEWEHFLSPYNKDKSALTFLTSYEGADVAATELGSNSATIWNISPPDKDRLIEDINGTSIITVRFRYTISRITHSKEVPGVLSEEKQYDIKPEDTEIRQGLSKMLNQSDTNVSVVFPFLFPKFVKVKTSDMKTVHQLTTGAYFDNDDISFRNISIKLYQNSVNGSIQTWWAVNEVTDDKFYIQTISQLPYAKKDALVVYLFNDKIFPQTLSSVAAGGILSMYTLIILVVFLRLRSFTLGHINRIMFEDLPNVDRILQLCYDIYLVREVREYALEEDLFAKLIFIYRSPETLIKVTRLDEEEHQKTD